MGSTYGASFWQTCNIPFGFADQGNTTERVTVPARPHDATPSAALLTGASAMVLCAGFGTRLRPLTDHAPKPLVWIGDRPLLHHIAAALRDAGFTRLVLNAHHRPEQLVDAAARGVGLPAEVVVEEEILGTAGGVANARSSLGSPVLVWAGDILCAPPISRLLQVASSGSPVCLAVAPRAVGSGTVGLGAAGEVVRLRGEVFGVEAAGGDYVGVAALGDGALNVLPERGCLIGDVCLPLLRAGVQLRTAPCEGEWSDSGNLDAYLNTNVAWLRQRGLTSVAQGASVADGITLERTVVAPGGRVIGVGKVSECVVWPGAVLTAPATRAVAVTTTDIVQAVAGATPL